MRDLDAPHAELNYWHPSDFTMMLGQPGFSYTHTINVREYANASYDDSRFNEQSAWELTGRMCESTQYGAPYGRGILVVKRRTEAPAVQRLDVKDLLKRASRTKVPLDYKPFQELGWVSDELARRLRCPISGSELSRQDDGLYSSQSGSLYPVSRGIPDMIPAQSLTDANPSNVVEHFTKLFSSTNIAASPLKRRVCSSLIKIIERTRSIRERRSRPGLVIE
jgi:uncharacterized protein YbaR (Trm112 family)